MTPTVGGRAVPDSPDLDRMRAERHATLQALMEAEQLDGLVLTSTSAVSYAAGVAGPAVDGSYGSMVRTAAIVVAGDQSPHVVTGVYPDMTCDFIGSFFSSGARIGVDDLTWPMIHASRWTFVSAATVLGAAKVTKTVDELACIRTAQRINEKAMDDVRAALRPGVRQSELSAVFLQRVFELGATANCIDPIWQPMPPRLAEGPWTVHGGVAFPTGSTDVMLRYEDVIWVDTGISYEGYASDFGRTWIVGESPTAAQREQFRRWRAVFDACVDACRPGNTCGDLDRAAVKADPGSPATGGRPWIQHFYVAHGVGTDSAEPPLAGADLGQAFDDSFVLAPGMVVVIEPVIWDDGHAGYRSEDIVAITDDGCLPLSDYPYDPF